MSAPELFHEYIILGFGRISETPYQSGRSAPGVKSKRETSRITSLRLPAIVRAGLWLTLCRQLPAPFSFHHTRLLCQVSARLLGTNFYVSTYITKLSSRHTYQEVSTKFSPESNYSALLRNIRAPKVIPAAAQASNTKRHIRRSDQTYPWRTRSRTPTTA